MSLFLVLAGYTYYQTEADTEKGRQKLKDLRDSLPALCQEGKWVSLDEEINDLGENSYGYKESVVFLAKGRDFHDEHEKISFTARHKDLLPFFNGRQVEIAGQEIDTGKVSAAKIRCVGMESNTKEVANRYRIMEYIAKEIGTLSPEKCQEGKWNVTAFRFVNETDVYVEYDNQPPAGDEKDKDEKGDEDSDEDDEDGDEEKDEDAQDDKYAYEGRIWLVRVTKLQRSQPLVEELACLRKKKAGSDRGETLRGKDIYEDSRIIFTYKFNRQENQWKPQ